MSLHPDNDFTIPADTVQAAHSALPKGNLYLRMRDELGVLYQDSDFAGLFSRRGQPAEAPWRLAVVTILQFAEGLTDRPAAEAVATRLDWKYLLGLPVAAPSFHYSVLSEFRERLLAGGAEQLLLDSLLRSFQERGLLRPRGRARTDSTHVLAAIHVLNRLELVGETLRLCLEALAEAAPEWLLGQVSGDWFDRYGAHFEQYRLPKGKAERQALAETVGRDGYCLLRALASESAPPEVRPLAAVARLRWVWIQQYYLEEGQIHWREPGNLPPAPLLIQSPHDAEAHYSQKRMTEWVGYKAHLTETCDDDRPHLIVNVETTSATVPDSAMTDTIHAHLAQRGLLPAEHLLDAGYVDADILSTAWRDFDVDVIGPVARDTTWQGQTQQGFDLAAFRIDWEAQAVSCPQGKRSQIWSASHDVFGNEVIHVRFDKLDCATCPVRHACTRAANGPRSLKLRPRPQHEALQAARTRQATAAFKESYAKRAGIEGTISQATNADGLRCARYLGLAKTHPQNIVTAAAINLARVDAWLTCKPRAATRPSKFMALRPYLAQPDLLLSPATAT